MLLWAGLLTVSSTKAQDITSTGNLITQGSWVTPMGSPISYPDPTIFDQCCSGGPGPAMNTSTNTLRFSYGSGYVQGTAIQSVGLGGVSALSLPGVKVTGLTYSWQIYNDLLNSGGTRGNLIGGISLTNKSNDTVENLSFDYSLEDTGAAFKLFSNTVTFESQYSASSLDRVIVSFTGNDKNWWAGYYGPRVRDVNIGLNYTGGGSSGGGGAGGTPSVPKSATTIPKLSTNIGIAADTTRTNAAVVNVGGVEMTNGEIAVIDNIPQIVKDNFVRDTNELSEKEKEKTVRVGAKAVEAVLPKRSTQSSSTATANVQTAFDVNDFTGIRIGTEDTRANGLGLNPNNPLNMVLNGRMVDSNDNTNSTSTVKRNIANNELAGGVDLTKMAVQPVGFNNYMTLTLTDASFYAPREAYPNQRVVDNARAQRLLQGASDRLHQEMVNSQYRMGQ